MLHFVDRDMSDNMCYLHGNPDNVFLIHHKWSFCHASDLSSVDVIGGKPSILKFNYRYSNPHRCQCALAGPGKGF